MREASIVAAVALALTALNWAGVAVMAGCCALSVKEFRAGPMGPVRAGMRRSWFWPAFWFSGVMLVAETLLPIVLVGWLPLAAVAGIFAANAVANVGAVPFRWLIWRAR